jgi:predicted Zn-dependent protease
LKAWLGIAAAALVTAGCGGGDEAGPPEIEEQERRLGAEQHPVLLAEFGGSYEGEEADYVKRIGGQLSVKAGLEGQCTFTVVNSDVVNAFAVPGCYIYITRGLMGIVNSEAEMASVLAHELGHIVGDHSERQQKRSLFRQLGVLAVGLVTGSERLTQIAGQAAQFFTLRYSRNQEYQSDDLGIRYLRQAGYDPYAAADMLDALGRQERFLNATRTRDEARSIPEWGRTHPLTENRIARARETAAATGTAPDALPENEARYLKVLDGLLYGDDPQQGFVQGRRFAHPVMRIGFEAPEGFTLTNSPQAILIEGPDGLRGEFGGGRLTAGRLEAYVSALLKQMLGDAQAQAGTAEQGLVNGLPALFVPVVVQTRQGPVEMSVAAYAGSARDAFHFVMISSPSTGAVAAISELFQSFRLLSEEEVRALKPREIRVVTVGPGDSARSLSAGMATDNKLDHFLMLNGRSADQPLKPGELVKIVRFAGQ